MENKSMLKHGLRGGLLVVFLAFECLALGRPDAPEGGTIYFSIQNEPPTLDAFQSRTDGVGGEINGNVFESLLTRDIDTFEHKPALAESWEVAKDGLTYTFRLREGATFSDGKPVTIEDVKFSFDAIKDPKYKAVMLWPYYESITEAKIIDARTIQFKAKQKYFQNLSTLGSLWILPKHYYETPSNKHNRQNLGSGPWILEEYKTGRQIVFKKNKSWWGWKVDYYKPFYRPDRMVYRVIRNENSNLETFKKGDLDFIKLSAEQYATKTSGAPWGGRVKKEEVQNLAPQQQPFIGWNLKNPLFTDKNVRLALAHLLDRETIIKKFYYDKAVPATGPWYRRNPAADPDRKPIPFDMKAAQDLLAKAGWKDDQKKGILSKEIDGKPVEFRFTLLNSNPDREKIFTFYKEALKKVGIDMSITNLDWNAFSRKIDDRSFEAVVMAWGGQVNVDPKQVWHSASAKAGGSNFVAYANAEVDSLIDASRLELDEKKRMGILRKIYNLIADDVPYLFILSMKSTFYGHSDRVGMEKNTYGYDIGTSLWWVKKP
jgi:microcin C transport system substrate-binding protein